MKKGQNNNFERPYFNTGVGGRMEYNDLIASLKNKSTSHKKAKNIARKKKRKN